MMEDLMVETLQAQQIMVVQLIREHLLFLSFGIQNIMHI